MSLAATRSKSRTPSPILDRRLQLHEVGDDAAGGNGKQGLMRQDTYESETPEFVHDQPAEQNEEQKSEAAVAAGLVDPADLSLTEVSMPDSPELNPRAATAAVNLKSARKLRHTSSGGSSVDPIIPSIATSSMRTSLRKRRQKSVRLRKNTESSEDLEDGNVAPRFRKKSAVRICKICHYVSLNVCHF